jgi:hypothetical protein
MWEAMVIDLDAIEATLARSPKTLDTDMIERLVEEVRLGREGARLLARSVKAMQEERKRLALNSALAALEGA